MLCVLQEQLAQLDRQTAQCEDDFKQVKLLTDRSVADSQRIVDIDQRSNALIEQSKLIRIVLDARELRDLSALQQAIDAAEPSSKHRAAALQQVMDSVCNEQLPRAQLVDCSSRSMLRLHVVPGLIDQLLRTIPFKLYLEQTLECPLASVEWIEVDRIGAWPAILPHKLLQVKWEGSDAADYPAEDSKSPVERLERSVRDFIRFIQLFPRQRCLSLSALAEGCLIHYLRLTLFPTATINNSESVDRQIALVNQAITDLDGWVNVKELNRFTKQLPRLLESAQLSKQLYRLRADLLAMPPSTQYYTHQVADSGAAPISPSSKMAPMDWRYFPNCRLSNHLLQIFFPVCEPFLKRLSTSCTANDDETSSPTNDESPVEQLEMLTRLYVDVMTNYHVMHNMTAALPQNYLVLHNDFYFLHHQLISGCMIASSTLATSNRPGLKRLLHLAYGMRRRADKIMHECVAYHQEEFNKQLTPIHFLSQCRDEPPSDSNDKVVSAIMDELSPLLADLTKLRRLVFPILPQPLFLEFMTRLVEWIVDWFLEKILCWGDMDAEMCDRIYRLLCDCRGNLDLYAIKQRLLVVEQSPVTGTETPDDAGGFLYKILQLLSVGSSSALPTASALDTNLSLVTSRTRFNLMLLEMLDLSLADIRVLLQNNFDGKFIYGVDENDKDSIISELPIDASVQIRKLIEAIFADSKQRRDFLNLGNFKKANR